MSQDDHRPDAALAALAAKNHGVFLTADAVAVGLTRAGLTRRSRKGLITRLHHGVYAVSGVPPSQLQTLYAACRWAGAGTAASHRSAAWLLGLGEFGGGPLEISGPRRLRSDRVVSHVTPPVSPADLTEIERVPTTTAERTLVDLAGVIDEDALEDALDSALRKRLTTLPRLRLRVAGASRRAGIRTLRRLLEERDRDGYPLASRFEKRLNRLLLSSGLPAVREMKIWNGGRFVARVDFCFPDAKLIVEADGYRWHSSRRAWQRDRARRNELTEMGWTVLQLTWDDLTRRPAATVARIRRLIHPRLAL